MAGNLKDFLDRDAIYLDANIFLHHAFGTNTGASEFLSRVESSGVKASTSILALEELTFKLIVQAASNEQPHPTIFDVKRLLKNPSRREALLRPVFEYLTYIDALVDLGLRIYDITGADAATARENILSYGLLPADALHLAVMRRKKIRHLASADADFAAVKEITLWRP